MREELLERITGGLCGVAVGDALGATLEFLTREDVERLYGREGLREIVGGGWLGLAPGDWTDDTEMTLAVARGIAEDPGAPVEPVGRRFMEWLATGPPDVGGTVRLALDRHRALGDWEAVSREVTATLGDRSAGNGALMRTLPVGLAYVGDADVARVSGQIAAMTHPHPAAVQGCVLYGLLISRLLTGVEPEKALADAAAAVDRSGAPHAPTMAMVEGLPERRYEDLRSTGYTMDTLEAALWCFLHASGVEEAVALAANLGGDADTVAAVTGGLAGVHWGIGAVPRRWLMRIGERELKEVAADLAAVREGEMAGCALGR